VCPCLNFPVHFYQTFIAQSHGTQLACPRGCVWTGNSVPASRHILYAQCKSVSSIAIKDLCCPHCLFQFKYKPSKCNNKLCLKGTHARDFHSLFLNFFCIFQSLIDTKRNTANIFKNNLQIRPDIQSFGSLPVFAESAKHG
jgi:hypothetical protein